MAYRIYISGPITGYTNLNEPAFRQAAARVEAIFRAEAVVPHDICQADPMCPSSVWCHAMVACLDTLATVDAVYFMDGWQNSRGARREMVEALRLGLRLIFE